jgi:hypothetical protein
MNIGRVKSAANRAKAVRFERGFLVVEFRDGREVHLPLRMYPTLARATPAQRRTWTMIGPEKGFHWPELDLDLSVEGLIQGLRESIPPPPRSVSRRSA